MLVAVLSLYALGVRLAKPEREVTGELVIQRGNNDKTTVARLFYPCGGSKLVKDGAADMELFEPAVKQLVRGRLDLRGIVRVDTAWHLQLWSCRRITSMEEQVMQRNNSAGQTGMHALYLRWWALVWEAAARQETGRASCDVADMPVMLGVPLEEVWPFIEWTYNTARGVMFLGGKEGLGVIEVRFLEPRVADEQYRIVVEGPEGTKAVGTSATANV